MTQNKGIMVYPNPFGNELKINCSRNNNGEVILFDMLGKVIEIKRGAPDQTFRFGDGIAAGMYFIEAIQSGQKEKATIKVVKQN